MKKVYDDDDGRTIADMSGVDHNSVMSGTFTGLVTSRKRRERRQAEIEDKTTRRVRDSESYEERKIRRTYTFGAMGAGLLIGFIYLAVFAILIVLLLFVWRVL